MNIIKIMMIMIFSLMIMINTGITQDEVAHPGVGQLNCENAKNDKEKAKCENCEKYVNKQNKEVAPELDETKIKALKEGTEVI